MLKSKPFIVTAVFLSVLLVFVFLKREAIFQEGNPIPFGIAAVKMFLQNDDIVKVKKDPETASYLAKQGDFKPFIKLMEKEGWELINRSKTQNLLVFEKENQSIGVGYKYYTKHYTIFTLGIDVLP
ncbi:hypothetical protein D1B31_01200 [Neobacillus notoginsengisoli]|uniref:Uncharacterized protein n=1 Tax=Neobacillus notoginsengisoli TaxID=1578198 RepID=A0A417YZN6_9BACI|nr:hypothetical protein [Neobacillus notoginsengisoli]RHW43315.1 hypothetical protein D1B31_01200 [Neobacillus notoginsengisoli]